MNNSSVVLSVVVISHNQKDVLKRCIDSILAQRTSFPVEVIVSDDRSTDGTREMLLNEYKNNVKTTLFNSDEINTSFVLERAAWNRINGLKLATGKYLIHTDGDDFFTSTDIFQLMVDKLEAHPECSLCCQNYCIVPEDNVNIPHIPFNKSPHYIKESILSAADFINEVGPIVNACVCARRNGVTISQLTGSTYDDNDITIRYLGNSKVAMINRCDVVYVRYDGSSCSTLSEHDKIFLFQGLSLVQLSPSLTGILLRKYLLSIIRISKHVVMGKNISDRVIKFYANSDMFIFNKLSNRPPIKDRLRYLLIYVLSIIIRINNYTPFSDSFYYKRMYQLVYKFDIPNDVII